MENVNHSIIGTRLCTNYTFLVQKQEVLGILVESPEKSILYSFDSDEKFPKVDNEVLEAALKSLLKSDVGKLDLIATFLSRKSEEYFEIAVKVFKDYWNELYNSVIADCVFEREITFDNLEKKYDFWDENK